jgi:hypothetical protein
MRRRNMGMDNRNLMNNDHGAGKGDADRSPNWRENYDEVAWPDGGKRAEGNGFVRKGGKIIKRYGPAEPEKDGQGPHIKV